MEGACWDNRDLLKLSLNNLSQPIVYLQAMGEANQGFQVEDRTLFQEKSLVSSQEKVAFESDSEGGTPV